MDDRAGRFRLAARRHLQGRTGPWIRYPEELHHEAVSYARTRQRQGDSLPAISWDLGVRPITLCRWLTEARVARFRRVEVLTPGSPNFGIGTDDGGSR